MRYITLGDVLYLHDRLIATSGGASGVRDLRALEAAIAQPKVTFGGEDLYPTVIEKAACLCSRSGSPLHRWKQARWARIDGGVSRTE